MKSAYGRQTLPPMLSHILREQLRRIEGLDPINVVHDPEANRRIPTHA